MSRYVAMSVEAEESLRSTLQAVSSNQQRGSPIICDASWLRAMGFSCRRFLRYLRSSMYIGREILYERTQVARPVVSSGI